MASFGSKTCWTMFFLFNHPPTTEIYTLSLHDALPISVGLVLQSAAQGSGGEIFTLDMGKPVKILDLARQLIELSGFTPDQDIRIEFTGLRPGEKLFEELSYRGERITGTRHPKIMRLLCEPLPYEQVRAFVLELVEQIDQLRPDEFKWFLKCAVPEYQPQLREFAASVPRQREAHVGSEGKDKRNGRPPSSKLGFEEPFHHVAGLDAPG